MWTFQPLSITLSEEDRMRRILTSRLSLVTLVMTMSIGLGPAVVSAQLDPKRSTSDAQGDQMGEGQRL